MILQSLDLLRENPAAFVLVIGIGLVGLIIGFTVHEFSHALTSHIEGDDTARRMGRLTFNPIKHIDLLGFILLLVVGFGWAKPVQVDPYNLRHGRFGMSMVALAGPLSNFVLAFVLGLVFRFGLLPVVTDTRFISGIVDILGVRRVSRDIFQPDLGDIQPDTAAAAGRQQGCGRAVARIHVSRVPALRAVWLDPFDGTDRREPLPQLRLWH